MEEKVSKQVETSPTLERRRAKYTVEDVRQLCGGISRSTVMREIRRKRLACYRARRTLRFSEEHITNYLERVEQIVKRRCAGWRPVCRFLEIFFWFVRRDAEMVLPS